MTQMNLDTIATGLMALAVWGFVWRRSLNGPLGWASPTALFAFGTLAFFIVPSLYWQLRPWSYSVPPYFEGIPLVFLAVLISAFPFIINGLLFATRTGRSQLKMLVLPARLNDRWLFMFLPLGLGIFLRVYLIINLGWQGRLAHEMPSLLNSKELALIIINFTAYYPAIYFLLVALGNKLQRRIGVSIWIFDGFFALFQLSRTVIFRFMLISLIYLTLLGRRISLKSWIVVGVAGILTMSLVSTTHYYMGELMGNRMYLTPFETVMAINKGITAYVWEDIQETHVAYEKNVILKALDDAMYRLYDARPSSAVMQNFPQSNPYLLGETFWHIAYSIIPRYFWHDKPQLGSIHEITNKFMYPEFGNPLGTLGELYINYGFLGVLFGSFAILIICRKLENIFRSHIKYSWIAVYPFLGEQLILASYSFSQRISEGIRALIVFVLIGLLLRLTSTTKVLGARGFSGANLAAKSRLLSSS